ncbi:Hydroxymethylglutaryl-CoA reductase [Lentibacillus sp. JNUCC-1]|uniref:hydroxymethylglutaryl-CoA reductase, degradative n=1 Tax=Lentibacillus sp. JNUCC-1 TaxID=2654513 RepID=UPI0012E88404|nr:hydroxymethylglutaryl-CoA reductase, degradative [Lentibacillus sp. JNUCC-1]MUV38194.1 Hydroxymethylglutaryl-CoA reductase [Lentibacillus sp. JNUCC-1]
MKTSRIPGFYNMDVEERRQLLQKMNVVSDEHADYLFSKEPLSLDTADHMVENVIGTFPLPLGLGLNFLINNKEYIVPMAIEEPSVVASASHIAKIVRTAGGFKTEATDRVMIGQIQVVGCEDMTAAKDALLSARDELIAAANEAYPSLVKRGGGAEDFDVRLLNASSDSPYTQMLIAHIYVNTCDAMGANIVNTMVESLAPSVESITKGKVYLRILSNLPDRCLARAKCVIPPSLLASEGFSGEEVRDGVVLAYEFADSDPYRAVTHNKGTMNGIDPVVIATGNDWRAVEAGAHAYAARHGHYGSMTKWSVDQDGNLVGELELPMSVGTVGGSINVHPMSKLSLELLDVESASELGQVMVAVGLAQNLGALKALVTEGIQKGHMALHSRSVAVAAGATGEMVDMISKQMIEAEDIRVGKAQQLLEVYKR